MIYSTYLLFYIITIYQRYQLIQRGPITFDLRFYKNVTTCGPLPTK